MPLATRLIMPVLLCVIASGAGTGVAAQSAQGICCARNVGETAGRGLHMVHTISGIANGYAANELDIAADNAVLGPNFGVGLYIQQLFGGEKASGGRSGLWADTKNVASTDLTNVNRNYVGVTGQGWASVSDGGRGLGVTTAKGAFFGVSGTGVAQAGATNLLNVTGGEFNTSVQPGASVAIKTILQLSGQGNDAVAGALEDDMLGIWDQNGAKGHRVGIMIGDAAGASQWPIQSSGTLFKTSGRGVAASGIDLTDTHFSDYAFRSPGFAVKGDGALAATQISAAGPDPRLVFVSTVGTLRDWSIRPVDGCLHQSDGGGRSDALRVCDSGTSAPAFVAGFIRTTPTKVARLAIVDPSPQDGDRAFVSDAVVCTFGEVVSGGGIAKCPVYYDGGSWKVG